MLIADEELQPPNKKVKMSPTEDFHPSVKLDIFEHISNDVFLLNVLPFCSFSETLTFRLISKHVNSVLVSFFGDCNLIVNVPYTKETFDLDQATNIRLKKAPTDSDEFVPFLKRFHNAKSLQCSGLSNMCFVREVPFTRLEALHITSCSFDVSNFKAISEVRFEHLKVLCLDDNPLKDEALQFLNGTSMPKLSTLSIMFCMLTSKGVQNVLDSQMDSLQVLLLDGNEIGKEGFLLALKLPLKFLSVGSNNIEIDTECDIVTDIGKVNITNNKIEVLHPSFESSKVNEISTAIEYFFYRTRIESLKQIAFQWQRSSFSLASSYVKLVRKIKNLHPIELNYYFEKTVRLLENVIQSYGRDEKACYKLGKIYEFKKMYKEAVCYYKDNSYFKSDLALGKLYFYVDGMKDWKVALHHFQRYCSHENRKSVAYELGSIYYRFVDYNSCEEILSRGELVDDPDKKLECDRMLGIIYYKGLCKKKKDYNKAFNLLISDRSDITSQYLCAKMYEKGRGTELSLPKAFEIYTMLSKQRHGKSMTRSARWYRNGIHVEQDYNKALSLFLESAESNPKSEADIGKAYFGMGDLDNAYPYLDEIPTDPNNPLFDLEGLLELCLLFFIRDNKSVAYPFLNSLLFETRMSKEEVMAWIQSIASTSVTDKSVVEILDHCQLILTTVDSSLFAFAMCKSFAEKQDEESYNIWINLIDTNVAHIVRNVFIKDVNALMLSLLYVHNINGQIWKLFEKHSFGKSFSLFLKYGNDITGSKYPICSAGLMFVENGMENEAVFFFNHVKPDEVFHVAMELEKRNYIELAIKYYEKMNYNPDALLRIGEIYCKQEHWMKAIEYFEKALNRNPCEKTTAYCYYHTGVAWLGLGNNSRAEIHFSTAEKYKDVDLAIEMTNLDGQVGRLERVDKTICSDDQKLKIAQLFHRNIESAIEMTNLDGQVGRLKRLDKSICSDDQKLKIARHFAKKGGFVRTSWEWYDDIQNVPQELVQEVADFLIRVGYYNNGITWSELLIHETEKHWYLFYKALCCSCLGRNAEALDIVTRSIDHTNDASFQINRCLKAKLLKRKGMHVEAMQVVNEVLQQNPEYKLAKYLMLMWSNDGFAAEIEITDLYEKVVAELPEW